MLHPVKDLSPEQRRTIETLLGHHVSEEGAVSIKSIQVSSILPPTLSPEERKGALERFDRYFAKIDARRAPVSEVEEEAVLNEALRSARTSPRPAH